MDPNETPEACLVRELLEELGIVVQESELEALTFASHRLSEDKHLLMPLWTVRDWEGEPVGAEGQKLAWVEVDKLDSFNYPEADYPLLPHVRRAMLR